MSRFLLTLSGAVIVSSLLLTGASAQQTGAAATAPAVPDGWFKLCNTNPKNNQKVCVLNIQLKNENGAALASVRLVEAEGVKQKGFTIIIPPGLLIQPGMRIQIDGANRGTAKFQVCSQQACVVETRFNSDIITSMKRGNQMKVIGIAQNQQQVEFPVTLTGFTAAYDGPPLDPKVTETLQQRLQRKADEARKRLLEGEGAPAANNGTAQGEGSTEN